MLQHSSVLPIPCLVFLFVACYDHEGCLYSFFHLFSNLCTLVLDTFSSLSFSGLPLETLMLQDGKSVDAGEHRHCKDMNFFFSSCNVYAFVLKDEPDVG